MSSPQQTPTLSNVLDFLYNKLKSSIKNKKIIELKDNYGNKVIFQTRDVKAIEFVNDVNQRRIYVYLKDFVVVKIYEMNNNEIEIVTERERGDC